MTSENSTAVAHRLGLQRVTTVKPSPLSRVAGARRVASGHRQPRIATHRADDSEVLPRVHFIAQLRREMRRVDRSGALLSLVIYRLAQSSTPADTTELRHMILGNKRETDMLGLLGSGVLAVACPDTSDEGARRFIEKIDAACSSDLHYSVETATYPDHLFAEISDAPSGVHAPSPLLLNEWRAPGSAEYLLKRPLDIVGALIALVLFSPLMLVTALAVKFSSPGPMILRQTRLGKSGTPFGFYKFRSMVVDGDDRIHREYVKSLIKGENDKITPQDGGEPLYKIKSDPRVTWVGRIIRKTSIDELPQLFNVLKGELSLVGPRPPLPYEAENYQSWHLRRVLDIKPGITGLWQVEGRSKVSFDDMVRMDLRYVRGCSLGLDMRILVKTVSVVIGGAGAS